MRFLKASLAAMLAASVATTPVMAQSASSLSVARASAVTEENSEVAGGFFLPLIATIAFLVGLGFATGVIGDDDGPTSP